MKISTERILTTHVGSLPRSKAVTDLVFAKERNEDVDNQLFNATIKAAVDSVVARQVLAGVDIVSDGEMSKISYSTYIKDRITGFEGDSPRNPPSDLEDYPEFMQRAAKGGGTPSYSRPCCVGKIEVKSTIPLEEDVANFNAAIVAHKPYDTFMNAASPGVIALFLPNNHYKTKDDKACLEKIRDLVAELPEKETIRVSIKDSLQPTANNQQLYSILPEDHRAPYNMHDVLNTFLDEGGIDEFQADFAKEMICGTARIGGILVGVIANSRGMSKGKPGTPPRFGGIVYTESAEKTAYFIENCNRHSTPLLFVQDVSGFMIGAEAEHSGIIRAGARFVEAMATAAVPKIVLTVNHASGAGYYAMAGQGFDPDFIFSLPTGRMGVMEGDSAAVAIYGTQIEKLKKEGKEPTPEMLAEMEKVRETYDRELDAKHAAARGLVDAIVTPENLRDSLLLALQTCLNTNQPHIGAFVLPASF